MNPPIFHVQYIDNSIGYYPLSMQNTFAKLPTNVPYKTQPITILFAHFKQDFGLYKITEFVKFQYSAEQTPLPEDYRIEKKANSDESIGTITEYNVEFESDPDSTHLEKSLNMIFSLAPYAQVKLIYCRGDDRYFYFDLFLQLRKLQLEYDSAVLIINCSIFYPIPTSDFYFNYLVGKASACKRSPSQQPIIIPIFDAGGNDGWIVDGKDKQLRYGYDLCKYTKSYICQVGGVVINLRTKKIIPFESTTCGFCPTKYCLNDIYINTPDDQKPIQLEGTRYSNLYYPTLGCEDILPTYQKLYNSSLPELILKDSIPTRSSFRVPDICHIAGPYILLNFGSELELSSYEATYGTSFSVIMFGIQYAHMKYKYPESFQNVEQEGAPPSFLSSMYELQQITGLAFDYIKTRGNPIDYPEGTQDPDPYNKCSYIGYLLPGKNFGLNCCGLGIPEWYFQTQIQSETGPEDIQKSVWVEQL